MPARWSCRRCSRPASGTSSSGEAALLGIAVGVETMCRLSTVAPTLTHKAGFHPTAVFGAVGAAAGVGAALKLSERQMVDALGTVGSMASGIIEYLAEGAWTKRLHAGWAAQSGLRAALLGRAGFLGSAHGVRRRARFLSRLRQHHQGRLRALIADDFGDRMGDGDAGVQALSVRNHDASLYRLRAAAWRSASKPTTSSRWSAKSARAPCTGCGSRLPPSSIRPTAMPANSRRPIASPRASCAAMSAWAIFPTQR